MCILTSVCTHVCGGWQITDEATWPPRDGITGSSELPNMEVESQVQTSADCRHRLSLLAWCFWGSHMCGTHGELIHFRLWVLFYCVTLVLDLLPVFSYWESESESILMWVCLWTYALISPGKCPKEELLDHGLCACLSRKNPFDPCPTCLGHGKPITHAWLPGALAPLPTFVSPILVNCTQ